MQWSRSDLSAPSLGGIYGAQELDDLITDFGGSFVLYPMAHIIDFKVPEQTGKSGAEFFERVDRAPPSHPPSPQYKRKAE